MRYLCVGSNANCASCDPNRAAEGADDADNNCATCNNGYSLTNNKKCVLTSNAGRAVDANSGKSNNLEHLDFAELSKEYSVDCKTYQPIVKIYTMKVVQDLPPHFHGQIFSVVR